MVIVEGPDGSGKSTLVSELVNALDLEVQPRACTSDNGVEVTTLRDWVDTDMSRPVLTDMLYDRHPLISEPIYGPIIRGRMADGFDDPYWLMKNLILLDEKEPRFIFCLPPWSEVESNVEHNHRPTTDHLKGVLLKSRALYDQYVNRAAICATSSGKGSTVIWDYTDPSDLGMIMRFARGRR